MKSRQKGSVLGERLAINWTLARLLTDWAKVFQLPRRIGHGARFLGEVSGSRIGESGLGGEIPLRSHFIRD